MYCTYIIMRVLQKNESKLYVLTKKLSNVIYNYDTKKFNKPKT